MCVCVCDLRVCVCVRTGIRFFNVAAECVRNGCWVFMRLSVLQTQMFLRYRWRHHCNEVVNLDEAVNL